ncbi:hypothetical protein OOZ63_08645 [Paucibacter sp. PLA-PC-4]|nr:hypothetical protein [Paucibacter sp. PLA-PC-4]
MPRYSLGNRLQLQQQALHCLHQAVVRGTLRLFARPMLGLARPPPCRTAAQAQRDQKKQGR